MLNAHVPRGCRVGCLVNPVLRGRMQVLIMLRTLLIPGKVPADTLKPKQRMEALALEKEVYKVLELTPRNGKEFCRAVKDVLEREITWVSWKKGGAAFGRLQDPEFTTSMALMCSGCSV